MDYGYVITTGLDSMIKSITSNSLTSRSRNEFDTLHYSAHDFMLDSTILTFSIFSDDNQIDVLVEGLATRNGFAWSDIGVKVESLS